MQVWLHLFSRFITFLKGEWIKRKKQKSENRFYLLCSPDIPWQADKQRENPTNRMELFELYKKELENLNHSYYILEGEKRDLAVISKIVAKKFFI